MRNSLKNIHSINILKLNKTDKVKQIDKADIWETEFLILN